jgi:D-amino-acid dehydrogenase
MMLRRPLQDDAIAVIGAGVIGCAIAQALAAQGRQVLLLDRAGPAIAGASFGNVGHIATEQVETLPSKQLLLGFWRQLFAFDGALDIPPRRVMSLTPWLARFAVAAFRQGSNTRHLAPLVRDGADSLERLLGAIGRRDLMRRNGHYAVWLGAGASERAAREATNASRLGVRTAPAPVELLRTVTAMTIGASAASLWFPDSAHVLDPAEVARALAIDATQRGASLERAEVRPVTDAPLVYADRKVAITPMTGRLRASSYLEFAGLEAPPDPRKPARLRAKLRALGYRCDAEGPSWMGSRPTLPDYLPGIGRLAGTPNLFYAVGHQHLGLTLAAPTAELIADLVAGRKPRFDIAALDLRRFGR